MSCKEFSFTVPQNFDSVDVKTFLRHCCGLTAHALKAAKYHEKGISRDGKTLRTSDIVRAGDVILLRLPEDKNDILPTEGRIYILFEDEYLLVVNKPAFMPVHPTKKHQRDTLANIVSFYQEETREKYTFRAMNRLDKDTSGCVVIAKDIITAGLLQGEIEKEYVAVCEGEITEAGTIDEPIVLALDSKIKRTVAPNGMRAVTHYLPLLSNGQHTLLSLTLETGRTHQIRCHMSAMGHPLAGDDLYGGSTEKIDRQALHCRSVKFIHPFSHDTVIIDTETPDEFLEILK